MLPFGFSKKPRVQSGAQPIFSTKAEPDAAAGAALPAGAVTCPDCSGSGWRKGAPEQDYAISPCQTCGGSQQEGKKGFWERGQRIEYTPGKGYIVPRKGSEACPACKGSSSKTIQPGCPLCQGTGMRTFFQLQDGRRIYPDPVDKP